MSSNDKDNRDDFGLKIFLVLYTEVYRGSRRILHDVVSLFGTIGLCNAASEKRQSR